MSTVVALIDSSCYFDPLYFRFLSDDGLQFSSVLRSNQLILCDGTESAL